jgi:threonyl-tRNA synthetase
MNQVTITLPDGSSRAVPAGTPVREIAAAISPRLLDAAMAAMVDDRMVDLSYPLERDATGAPDGGGRDESLPRRPVRHRPGH